MKLLNRDVRGAVFTAVRCAGGEQNGLAVRCGAVRCGEQISLRCGAVKKDQ